MITEQTILFMKNALANGSGIYYRNTANGSLLEVEEIAMYDWARDGDPEECAIFKNNLGCAALLGNDPSDFLVGKLLVVD